MVVRLSFAIVLDVLMVLLILWVRGLTFTFRFYWFWVSGLCSLGCFLGLLIFLGLFCCVYRVGLLCFAAVDCRFPGFPGLLGSFSVALTGFLGLTASWAGVT